MMTPRCTCKVRHAPLRLFDSLVKPELQLHDKASDKLVLNDLYCRSHASFSPTERLAWSLSGGVSP